MSDEISVSGDTNTWKNSTAAVSAFCCPASEEAAGGRFCRYLQEIVSRAKNTFGLIQFSFSTPAIVVRGCRVQIEMGQRHGKIGLYP